MAQAHREEELQFPLVCHFKIIAEDLKNMLFVIETVLLGMGVNNPVEVGRRSAQGKYVTYNVSVTVDSKESMARIDQALREIEGVRVVL